MREAMKINGHNIDTWVVVYDGCHKIFISAPRQEKRFIKHMESNGWEWEEDFFRVESVDTLRDMYINSYGLRFIQQIGFRNGEVRFKDIIPQCAFIVGDDNDCYFDEEAAAKALVA
jgi:hypothetical protein